MTFVVVSLGPNADLKVAIPVEKEREIAGTFLTELRSEIDRAHMRYAPNHRGFLLELRERVLLGIEPNRLGRGGLFTFVDRVAYRMWDERRRDITQAGLMVAEDRVTRPPQTGEMPAVRPPARPDLRP